MQLTAVSDAEEVANGRHVEKICPIDTIPVAKFDASFSLADSEHL